MGIIEGRKNPLPEQMFGLRKKQDVVHSISYKCLPICDKSQQKVPVCLFWKIWDISLSKGQLNKLCNYTKCVKIEPLLLKILEKDNVFFLSCFLFIFNKLLAQYLQFSLADIRYLWLWCVTYVNRVASVVYRTVSDKTLQLLEVKNCA